MFIIFIVYIYSFYKFHPSRCTDIQIQGMYLNGLSAVPHQVQQWLSISMESPRIHSELFSPQGLMSQLVFSVCWSPEEIESNAREGMGLLAKARTGRQEENQLPVQAANRWPGLKRQLFPPQKGPYYSGLLHVSDSIKKKKSFTGVPSYLVLVNSRRSEVDNQG